MVFNETKVKDCFFISCDRWKDTRGFFQETFEVNKYKLLKEKSWKQSNWSSSKKGVLRGMHFAPFSKLVTCVCGKIFDVVVDLRRDSSTFMKFDCLELSADSGNQVYVPSFCAHGFLALEDSVVTYFQSGTHLEYSLNEKEYNYNCFGINWPLLNNRKYILSDKDRNAPNFSY